MVTNKFYQFAFELPPGARPLLSGSRTTQWKSGAREPNIYEYEFLSAITFNAFG
jgi:hypothetical protein